MITMYLNYYPWVEDKSVVSKFDYYLYYTIIFESRIKVLYQSLIITYITLLSLSQG